MKIEKVEKFAANWHDKTGTVIHIRNLKQELVLEEVHRTIKFNQKAWLKPYIDMNTENLMNNSFLKKPWKMWENVGPLNLQQQNKKKKLVDMRTIYHTTKNFLWKPIRNRNEKNTDIMNKYLGLSLLKLSKIVKYEFWYDYVKLKYGEKSKTVIWIQTVSLYTWYDIYKDIAEDVETRSDSSNYQLDRPLPERKK